MKKFIFLILVLISGFAFSQGQITIKAESEINDNVEMGSVFPGGLNAFRQKIADNFRPKKVRGIGVEKCQITFIIETDGTMSNLQTTGSNESFNQEAMRAVSKINIKFNSAKLNGVKARSRYRIPLTMIF